MLDKINGLPAHVLLIHVVVIFVPLAAVMLVASAIWPAARAKLGFLSPAVALVALVFVPITTHAGEWLQDHLPNNIGHTNKAIEHHAHLGGELLPWVIGIFVMSAAVWILGRRYDLTLLPGRSSRTDAAGEDATPSGGGTATLTRTRPATLRPVLPVWITAAVAVIAIAVSVGGVVQLVRIGDAGAKATWSGSTTG
jgi:hypothetical protein